MICFDHVVFKEVLTRVSGNKKQKDIAEDLHVSVYTLNRWFKGKQTPNAEDLLLIANTYKCSVDELLGLDGLDDETEYSFGDFIQIFHGLEKYNKVSMVSLDGIYTPSTDVVSIDCLPDGNIRLTTKNAVHWMNDIDPKYPEDDELYEQYNNDLDRELDMGVIPQLNDFVVVFSNTNLDTMKDMQAYYQITKLKQYKGTHDNLLQLWFKSVKDKPLSDF